MNTQLDMFNDLENDFEKNYNIATAEEIKEKDIDDDGKELFKDINVEEENFTNDLNEIKSFFVKE